VSSKNKNENHQVVLFLRDEFNRTSPHFHEQFLYPFDYHRFLFI